MTENQDGPSRIDAGGGFDSAARRGRPRSDRASKAIRDAALELLVRDGFTRLRLEHVAARAGVGKATIYRRWPSKEALAQDLLSELATPHLIIDDSGDTRTDLLAAVTNAIRALTETSFGPVIRTLLSQIAVNPSIGDPFRATIVQGRRDEIGRAVRRGIDRGDLRPDADADVATELLVGPVYFRLIFGGELDQAFAEHVADTVYRGFARAAPRPDRPSSGPAQFDEGGGRR